MKFIRKSLGLFIIVLMALPLLFGVIWGAGLIKATTSPYFLSELPKEIIDRLPGVIQDTVEIVKQNDGDEEIKAWLAASEKAGIDWEDVMKTSGVLDWINVELKEKIGRVGQIFEGNEQMKNIRLNLKPLKQALKSEAIYDAIKKVLLNLPEGTADEVAVWVEYIETEGTVSAPVVRPLQPEAVVDVIRRELFSEIDDMHDYIDLVRVSDIAPYGSEFTKFFNSISFIMFMIPGILILAGAFVGGYGMKGFLKWCGVSTLAGGIITLISVKIVQGLVTLSSWVPSANIEINDTFVRVGSVMMGRIEELFALVTDALFDPVGQMAKVVCVVGIVIWAISFAIVDQSNDNVQPAAVKSE